MNPLARDLLPHVEAIRGHECPELPLVWLVTEVQAELSWDLRAHCTTGATVLMQMMPASWTAIGTTGWDVGAGPPAEIPVIAVGPLCCRTLRPQCPARRSIFDQLRDPHQSSPRVLTPSPGQ